jgi:hypothetical protein
VKPSTIFCATCTASGSWPRSSIITANASLLQRATIGWGSCR